MKFEITHSCGHSQTYQLYGKMDDRLREEKSLAGMKCDACYKAACEAEAAAARMAAEEFGLPALTGSDKQVTWAETIRAKLMAEAGTTAEANRDKLEKYAKDEASKAAGLAIVAEAMRSLAGKTEAGWWIDNRDLGGRYLFDKAAKAAMATIAGGAR